MRAGQGKARAGLGWAGQGRVGQGKGRAGQGRPLNHLEGDADGRAAGAEARQHQSVA